MNATFTKLNDGSWGIRVAGTAVAGQTVTVSKRDGSTDTKTVGRVVHAGNGVTICTIGTASGPAAAAAPVTTGRTSRKWADVKVGSVITKKGKRFGVVTEIDVEGGYSVVNMDRAAAVENDDDDYKGGARRRRTYVKTALIGRAGCDADADIQPGYSVLV